MAMNDIVNLTRRGFLKGSAGFASALVLGFHVSNRAWGQDAIPGKVELNAFLTIAADGAITVFLKHSEMGQGIGTSIPMLIAEEMDADWSQVSALPGDARAEFAHTEWGIQATGGSSSTLSSYEQMRKVGATAKAMLLQAAAARSKLEVDKLRTENGAVIGPETGQRWTYGELAADAAKLAPPGEVVLKDRKAFKLIGTAQQRRDAAIRQRDHAIGIRAKAPIRRRDRGKVQGLALRRLPRQQPRPRLLVLIRGDDRFVLDRLDVELGHTLAAREQARAREPARSPAPPTSRRRPSPLSSRRLFRRPWRRPSSRPSSLPSCRSRWPRRRTTRP